MKRNKKLFQLIYAAVFSALIFVVTAYLPHIPTAAGYVHLGDGLIFIAAALLNAPYAIVAAALGASLRPFVGRCLYYVGSGDNNYKEFNRPCLHL